MKNRNALWLSALLVPLLVVFGACATGHAAHHSYLMKGSIVDSSAAGVTICIGKKDGAQVGQELSVSHVMQPQKGTYTKQTVGSIKITQIIDEHFAKAVVTKGKAELGDIVELE